MDSCKIQEPFQSNLICQIDSRNREFKVRHRLKDVLNKILEQSRGNFTLAYMRK